METSKINMYMAANGSKFAEKDKMVIMEGLKNFKDENHMMLHTIEMRNPVNWLLIYLFVPVFCLIDRIVLGQVGLGILKLITIGGLGLWVFIDIFTIMPRIKASNFKKIQPFLT